MKKFLFNKATRFPVCFLLAAIVQLGAGSALYGKSSTASKVAESPLVRVQIRVSGTVTDSAGVPLAGVTVRVKGSNTGTTTNASGHYEIEVPDDATLVFSYLGYTARTVAVNQEGVINITLQSAASGLNEVVVVAYGKEKKADLTAAVAQISNESLERRPVRSLADALQGLVAGLNIRAPSGAPEASLDLNIRGFTGFDKSDAPLILVDGVERDINDVNPNDVESVSVLKDAAATAIYGSRAPYGAVLITTKSGAKNQKASITYSANVRASTVPNQPVFPASWVYMQTVDNADYNDPNGNRNPFYSQLTIDRAKALAAGNLNDSVFTGLNPAYVPYGSYAVNPTAWAAWDQAFANTDWFKVGFKKYVFSQQHDISISGGGTKSSYYIGLGYNQTNGIFKGIKDHKDRYSVLGKYDVDVTRWLSVNLSTNYVRDVELGPNYSGLGSDYATIWNVLARTYPWFPVKNPNGSIYRFNPVAPTQGLGGSEGVKGNDLTLTGGLTLNPLKGLQIKGQYTWRISDNDYSLITLPVYQILPNGDEALTQRSAANSSLLRQMGNTGYYTVNVFGTYEHSFTGGHNFSALLGFQEEENDFRQISVNTSDFITSNITTIGNSYNLDNADEQLTSWATQGYFGRFRYNYREKYIIEFNGRYDGNSRFNSPNPKEKWDFSPSVSAAWNVAQEDFWPFKSRISLFKIRGSWANSGNANIIKNANYFFSSPLGHRILTNLALDGEPATTVTAPGMLVPASLTWEKPRSVGIGIDASALRNRLDFSYDWYQRTTRDQAGRATPLPTVLGIAPPLGNNTTSETRGYELTLKWHDQAFVLAGKPFTYHVGFRTSDYIGYVVAYKSDGTGQIGTDGRWIPGQLFGQNRFVHSNGIIQNESQLDNVVPSTGVQIYTGDLSFQDRNGDGTIKVGNTWYSQGDAPFDNSFSYPRNSYGITVGADWNGFNLLVNLDGVGRWKIYTNDMYVFGTNGNVFFAPFFEENLKLGYWTQDNTGAFFPRNSFNNKNRGIANDQYALNLANLRIRNIQLGYDLPASMLRRLHLRSLGIYFSGENLGFIYYKSYIKLDPELLAASSGEGYPSSRVFSLGFTIGL